jgi:hypothetical protein
MGRMSAPMKWWSRVTAAVTGVMLMLVVPVHAWAASNGTADVAIEAAKYRRRRTGGLGVFGFFGGLCCLLVVGAIVLGVLLILRNRRRR